MFVYLLLNHGVTAEIWHTGRKCPGIRHIGSFSSPNSTPNGELDCW